MGTSLPTQPLQVADFAGGNTDNFIAGGPTRYMSSDNFLVTVDRKLEERYGSQWLYTLPSNNTPVDALLPHDNEQYLLAAANKNIFIVLPSASEQSLLGPTGNPPLPGATPNSSMSWGEWSHHTLIVDDSLSSYPIKIYRGAAYPTTAASIPAVLTNFNAVQSGLPEPSGNLNISNAAYQANCITLANQLRTNMLLHIGDYGPTIDINLHYTLDSPDYTLLSGSTPATDLPSLYALIGILITAYTAHVTDAILFNPIYHWNNGSLTLNYYPSYNSAPTTLVQAAAALDDLKTKFFMHQMAPTTHDSSANYNIIGRYLVTQGHIGSQTTGPVLSPTYTQSLAIANLAKSKYNAHIADATIHFTADLSTLDTLNFPDAVDLDTLIILIVYLYFKYDNHWADSDAENWSIVGTTTATSGSVTNVSTSPGTSPAYQSGLAGLGVLYGSFPIPSYLSGSTGSTSFSVTKNATTSLTNTQMKLLGSKYHIGTTTNSTNETISTYITDYPPTAAYLSEWLAFLSQTIAAFNAHDENTGVHFLGFEHTIFGTVPTLASYAYAFHWFYQYMRYDGVIFNVVGTPVFVGPVQTEVIGPTYTQTYNPARGESDYFETVVGSTFTITNIPTLVNGSQNNWDTANVQMKIFRTIDSGATYYQDGIIPNGTTSYIDTVPDVANISYNATQTILNQQPVIYTSGGVVNFDPAPVCKYITIMQNTAYFGAIVDTGQTFLNRIRQSIQNNLDSSPGSFFLDLPDNIMGLSNTRNILVALCAHSCYQVSGAFNQLGQGQMAYQAISDTIGCVSSASIVRTDVGIFFAGTDGFYYTDGYQLIKLSSELNNSYLNLVQNSNQQHQIYGAYDRYYRRVYWSTQPNSSDYSATQNWIFHVNFGVTAAGVFTTASNGENFRPSSQIFYQGLQYRGDARGYILQHTPLIKTDPQINISASPASWNTSYIPYNYASCAIDFGTALQRKWTTRFTLHGKNIGNVAAQVTSITDNGRVPPLPMSPMLFNQNVVWGQPNLIWGKPNAQQPIVWNNLQEIDMWRRFPATQLRSDFKQITITPAFLGVYRYEDWPLGSYASIQPQGGGVAYAQLLTGAGYVGYGWPNDVIGYVFAQQGDGYVATYAITGLTTTTNSNDTLILADPGNVLTSSTVSWVIRGYMKNQRLSITSYAIHFTLLGKAQQAYPGLAGSGENT